MARSLSKINRVAAGICTITGLSLAFHLYLVLQYEIPFGDGGLFLIMMDNIRQDSFALPEFTSYNGGTIPFAYPPFALYTGALVQEATGVSGIDVLRFLPLLVSGAAVPAFYLMADSVLRRRSMAFIATCYFAASVIFVWTTMGGGLTRSFGMLFAILAIYHLHELITSDPSVRRIGWATAFVTLVCLSHSEMAWIALIFCGVFLLTSARSPRPVLATLLVGLLALGVTAPWWGLVIARHGLDPYSAAAFHAGSWRIWAFLSLLLPLLRRHLLTCLLVSLFLLGGRNIFLALSLGLSLAFGQLTVDYGLEAVEHLRTALPNGSKPPLTHFGRATAVAMLFVASSVGWFGLTFGFTESVRTPTRQELNSFQAVSELTTEDSRFLVLGTEWNVEWFPVFAKRVSLTTYQGHEFMPGHDSYQSILERRDAMLDCTTEACLTKLASHDGLAFTHVYLLKASQTNSSLQKELDASPTYELVFDDSAARVYVRQSLTDSRKVDKAR